MEPLAPDDVRRIGPYRLQVRLGAGGMGQVYLGRRDGAEPAAVKVVHGRFAADPSFRARFARWAHSLRDGGGRRARDHGHQHGGPVAGGAQ